MANERENENKIKQLFKPDLENVSRQRLRAVHMSLRRYGNVESRISQKDLQHAFDENKLVLTSRHYQTISDIFEDNGGIDFERFYKQLEQLKETLYTRPQNDDFQRIVSTNEQRNKDLLIRIEETLVDRQKFFNIDEIRTSFQSRDINKIGKISKMKALEVFSQLKVPLYGVLLKSVVNKCIVDSTEAISWPELVNMLDRAQQRAWTKHPEMAELPKHVKKDDIVNPDVVDELSSSAKSKVVSKLLKKASVQREKSALSKHKHTEKDTSNDNKVITNPTPKIIAKPVNLTNPAPVITPTTPVAVTIPAPVTMTEERNVIPENDWNDESFNQTENVITYSDQLKVNLQINGKVTKLMKPSSYNYQDMPIDPPKESIQLEWVYGYRGNDCRKNINLLSNGDIIYFIANIVVLYNKEAHKQRHYLEHTEDIKSIGVHSNGLFVATGQQSGKDDKGHDAHIRIWRSDDLKTLYTLGESVFQKSVVCIAFQLNSDLIASVDNGQGKRLTIWNTSLGRLVAEVTVDVDVMCDISFNMKMSELFVTAGKEHLSWWKINEESGKIVPYAQANYETYLRARFVICACHNDKGDLITGDSNGTIYVWGNCGNKITNFVKHGHEGPVFTLFVLKNYLLSGGRDGVLCSWEWTKNMDCAGKMEIAKTEGGIRMVQGFEGALLIGTTMNSMLATTVNQKGGPLEQSELDPLPITQGHFDDLRGLCEIQRSFMGADFLTTGTDGIICKFNTTSHEPAWKLVMKGSTFLCADCSTNGKLLCLGTQDGYLVIMEINTDDFSVTELLHRKISKDRLECIALSPDHNAIAVGGYERSITIYICAEKEDGSQVWQCQGKCWGHRGYLTAIDWSAEKIDGAYYLQSSSSFPEQLFWNAVTCEKVDWKDINGIAWNTQHCLLDYNLIGVWCSKLAKEAVIKSIAINTARTLVAVGDSRGNISLFRYPCNKEGVYCHTYKSLMSVQTVCFCANGKYLIAVGGQDSCITQWRVNDRDTK